MSESPRRVRCIYCDQHGPRSREDILSWWMDPYLPNEPDTDGRFQHASASVPRLGDTEQAPRIRNWADNSLHHMKAHDVCSSCNNIWMSQVESAAKPLLIPLMMGERRLIDAREGRILAAWAQIKSVAFDARAGQNYGHKRLLPASLGHTICSSVQPIPNLVVCLGHFEDLDEHALLPWGHGYVPFDSTSESDPGGELVCLTLTFRRLLVQVRALVTPAETISALTQDRVPDTRVILPIWPQLDYQGVWWPPPMSIPFSEFIYWANNATPPGWDAFMR